MLASPLALALITDLRVLPALETDHAGVHLRITVPAAETADWGPPVALPPRMLGTDRIEAWAQLLAQPEYTDQIAGVTTAAVAISEQTLFSVCDQFDAIVSEFWGFRLAAPAATPACPFTVSVVTPSLARRRGELRRALRRNPCSAEARALRARSSVFSAVPVGCIGANAAWTSPRTSRRAAPSVATGGISNPNRRLRFQFRCNI